MATTTTTCYNENSDIVLTRGDTGFLKFTRLDGEGEPISTTPSAMYFTVKRTSKSSTVIFQKVLSDMTFDSTTGEWTIKIEPEDTDELSYGPYEYDLEVITEEYKKTIAIGTFFVTKEITFAEDEV